MLIHLFSEKLLGEDLDAIEVGLGMIATGFDRNIDMVGVFNGASSDSLITDFNQHIVEIAPEIQEQYHVVVSTQPIVPNLHEFVKELNVKLKGNRDAVDAMADLSKASLESVMERDMSDSEASLMTLFLVGDIVIDDDMRIGDCNVHGHPVHFVILRYGFLLPRSPAFSASARIKAMIPTTPPLLH